MDCLHSCAEAVGNYDVVRVGEISAVGPSIPDLVPGVDRRGFDFFAQFLQDIASVSLAAPGEGAHNLVGVEAGIAVYRENRRRSLRGLDLLFLDPSGEGVTLFFVLRGGFPQLGLGRAREVSYDGLYSQSGLGRGDRKGPALDDGIFLRR